MNLTMGMCLQIGRLRGTGIIMKPIFEVANHIAEGRLIPVAIKNTHQSQFKMACLFTHRKRQDPKKHVYSWSLLLTELVAHYALTLLKLNYHDKLNTQMAKAKAEHGNAMAPTCQNRIGIISRNRGRFPMESSTC